MLFVMIVFFMFVAEAADDDEDLLDCTLLLDLDDLDELSKLLL